MGVFDSDHFDITVNYGMWLRILKQNLAEMTQWHTFAVEKLKISTIMPRPKPPKVKQGVTVLTKSNFKQVIRKHEPAFVKFYSPKCKHCQKMAPEWIKMAK